MNRKLTVILIGVTMLLMLCSCDSEEVKQAKEDFAAGHYTEVVKTLDGQENLSQEAQDMLAISGANVAYENEDYLVAVKTLITASTGIQTEQFEEMFNAALDDAISNRSADDVIELLSLDESKADAVYDAVTKVCNEKEYNGFVVLDGLVKKLDDGDLKTKLTDYDKEYKVLRAEAFIVGKWERNVDGIEKNARIKISPYQDNFIGTLIRVGDDQKNYHFQKDDMMMQDFSFENGKKFVYSALVRYDDGTSEREIVSCKINYKKDSFSVHYSEDVEESDLVYKRID